MVKSYTMRENNKMTYKNYVTQNISKIRLKTMSSDNMTSFPSSMAEGGRDAILQYIKLLTLVAISKRYRHEKNFTIHT